MMKDHVLYAIKMAVHTHGRSVVWHLFMKVSGKETKCEDCGDSIATCGNTTNLFKVYMLHSLFMAEHTHVKAQVFSLQMQMLSFILYVTVLFL